MEYKTLIKNNKEKIPIYIYWNILKSLYTLINNEQSMIIYNKFYTNNDIYNIFNLEKGEIIILYLRYAYQNPSKSLDESYYLSITNYGKMIYHDEHKDNIFYQDYYLFLTLSDCTLLKNLVRNITDSKIITKCDDIKSFIQCYFNAYKKSDNSGIIEKIKVIELYKKAEAYGLNQKLNNQNIEILEAEKKQLIRDKLNFGIERAALNDKINNLKQQVSNLEFENLRLINSILGINVDIDTVNEII